MNANILGRMQVRRKIIGAVTSLVVLSTLSPARLAGAAASTSKPAVAAHVVQNIPQIIQVDKHLHLSFGPELRIIPRGLQPSMFCTSAGTLIVQAQVPEKPFPSRRITYFSALETVISRDRGKTWTKIPLKPGENGENLEGGAVQLRDGTILVLDTYITPGDKEGWGMGQLYTSTDDWRSLHGPMNVPFKLPGIDFHGSTDDGGRPHAAQRLHRRIIELPNGDLLTTFYGWMKGDNSPCPYMPSMKKTRVMLARSTDRGQSWVYATTIAVDPKVGTEGFDEPVICRVTHGPDSGRIICLMRTGRELYQATSDDQGLTWSAARPLVFANLDVYRTDLWVDRFRTFKDFKGKLLDENNPEELRGAVVDPDLIEMRNGILVAAFGVRIPQKLCWRHPDFPWNGNYIAFSLDHGSTWSQVVRLTGGVLTTQYMAITEMPTPGRLFVTYDLGGWSKGMHRDVVGRIIDVSTVRP